MTTLAVSIISPTAGQPINTTTVTVTGTVTNTSATVTVNGVAAAVGGESYTANSVPLPAEGLNTLLVMATAGVSTATAQITVIRDTIPPTAVIESPLNGATITTPTVTVVGSINDVVIGTIDEEDCSVTLTGPFGASQAQVANRTFIVPNYMLAPEPNQLMATPTDSAGNVGIPATVTVTRAAAVGQRLMVASGGNQSGAIGQMLPNPIVIQAVGPTGQPLANRFLTFLVTRNTGLIGPAATPASPAPPEGGMSNRITVQTDANGMAAVDWQLGGRVGVGNNRITVSAIGFVNPLMVCASATGSTCSMLAAGAGTNRAGAVSQPLPIPFEIVATDMGANPCGSAPVTFTVIEGGGHFAGSSSVSVNTNGDGLAAATLTLGPGAGVNNNVVRVTAPGVAIPVTFRASGMAPVLPDTTFSGVVLDNGNVPIPNATVTITEIDPVLQTVTDEEGMFTITGVPSGHHHLVVNGTTTTRPGLWPTLSFVVDVVGGAANSHGMPIFLPELDEDRFQVAGGDTDVDLTMDGLEGFSIRVFANSATFPDGSTEGPMGVTQVSSDQVPMPPMGGAAPPWVGAFQPPNVVLNPPADLDHMCGYPLPARTQKDDKRQTYRFRAMTELTKFIPLKGEEVGGMTVDSVLLLFDTLRNDDNEFVRTNTAYALGRTLDEAYIPRLEAEKLRATEKVQRALDVAIGLIRLRAGPGHAEVVMQENDG